MALSAVEAILFSARKANQEEVDQLCRKITDILAFPEKTAECCTLLRQLFVLLQASRVEPCVPKTLLREMVKTLNQTEGERSGNKQCRLCALVVRELIDGEHQVAHEAIPSPDKIQNKALLGLYMIQGDRQICLQHVLPAAVRWLCTKDFESQCHALSFLVALSSLHAVLQQEQVGQTSEQLCTWLMSASVYQAHNTYSINPFRKDEDSQVTEIDGTPCRNFFTILNIGQYYTDDQYLNIYSFSLLYKWLHHCSLTLHDGDHGVTGKSPAVNIDPQSRTKRHAGDGSPRSATGKAGTSLGKSPALSEGSSPRGKSLGVEGYDSPRKKSPLAGSPGSKSIAETGEGRTVGRSTPAGGEGSPRNKAVSDKVSVTSQVLRSLVSRSVDYCFRVMDQCERKAKVASDAELQAACLMEVVVILDLVCGMDKGQIPRVHQEMRRLYTRLAHDYTHCSTVLRVLQFFLNHSAAVVHDPQEVYTHFFDTVLSQQFRDPGLTFDVIVFLSNNISTLCYNTNILSLYFPNILKILAWHPRTFMLEFLDLLPAMMSPTTALEVFHTLLDLPCLTAALEVSEQAKKSDAASVNLGASGEPSNSVEAFHVPRFKPLFNFVCRTRSGQGDTINRLSSLHKVLEDVRTNARVIYCSQVVPVMVRRWFQVITEEADEEFLTQIVPAILERSGLLFDLADYKADVIMILSEELLKAVETYPDIVLQHVTDFTDFIHITNNMRGRPNLYGNLIYSIGEYTASQRIAGCTPELIGQYFDVLEVVTYEVCGTMAIDDDDVSLHPKILCHLVSAMAKLSSRRQDLIPRAILCLTKVAKQRFTLTQDPLAQEALVSSAQEHINLLKVPNFAVTVLNPPADIYSGRWHRDQYSLPVIIRGIKSVHTFSS